MGSTGACPGRWLSGRCSRSRRSGGAVRTRQARSHRMTSVACPRDSRSRGPGTGSRVPRGRRRRTQSAAPSQFEYFGSLEAMKASISAAKVSLRVMDISSPDSRTTRVSFPCASVRIRCAVSVVLERAALEVPCTTKARADARSWTAVVSNGITPSIRCCRTQFTCSPLRAQLTWMNGRTQENASANPIRARQARSAFRCVPSGLPGGIALSVLMLVDNRAAPLAGAPGAVMLRWYGRTSSETTRCLSQSLFVSVA